MRLLSIVQMIPAPGRWAVVVTCVVAAVVQGLPNQIGALLKAEAGPFEMVSSVIWLVAAVMALQIAIQCPSLVRWASTAMLVWAFLREMDFQKRFTYRSIESIGYYTRPDAPWPEKLTVIAILAPFAAAGIILALHVCREWKSAWNSREPWLGYFLGAAILVILALCCEKAFKLVVAEEVLETGVALMFLMLTWSSRKTRQASCRR